MTLEEEYELSCYEEIAKINDKKNIYLVRHNISGELFVKKRLRLYDIEVYKKLQWLNIANVPRIILCVESVRETVKKENVQSKNELIIIEEYIHGKTLEAWIRKGNSQPEITVLQYMIQLCDILEQLHSCTPSLVHRDIKPSNLMISMDGVLKLVDFNATKVYKDSQKEDTFLMGTQEYAAPEQYGFAQSDPRTDIYACGIVMNVLLTGEFPKTHLYDGLCKSIIEGCIAVEPKKRFQNIRELRNELDKVLNILQGKRQRKLSEEELLRNEKERKRKNFWRIVNFIKVVLICLSIWGAHIVFEDLIELNKQKREAKRIEFEQSEGEN